MSYNDEGTPQGGVISPLLSNIYLHEVLDDWFMKVVQPRMQGKSYMVRFADDAVLGFETKVKRNVGRTPSAREIRNTLT